MKNKNKLSPIAILLIGIAITTNTIAQTTNYIAKFSGGLPVDTQSPIFENGSSQVGIGTTSPGAKLDISAGSMQAVINANGTNNPEIRWQNSGTTKLEIGISTCSWCYIANSATNDVIIRQSGGQKILFSTSSTGSTNDLTLDAGKVGIGTHAPTQTLQVVGGNIDLKTPTNSYMINSDPVLWHNNNTADIFVGKSAGNGSMTGHANTYIGYATGLPTTSGDSNTCVGYGAGTSLTSSKHNTLIGVEAGKSLVDNSAAPNVAVGYQALYSADAQIGMNTAVGYKALYSSNTPCNSCNGGNTLNTAVGYETLYNTQAYGGCAFGFHAGYSNTTGCYLIAIGEEAAFKNTSANGNLAVGYDALHENDSLENNVAIGTWALHDLAAFSGPMSSENVAVGHAALTLNRPNSLTTGIYNTAIGNSAGRTNILGKNNSFLGYFADILGPAGTYTVDNSTVIGANAAVATNNTMVLGDNAVSVGIGLSGSVTGPSAKMHVFRDIGVAPAVTDPTALRVENNDQDVAGAYTGNGYGIHTTVLGRNQVNYGGWFRAENAYFNEAGNFHATGAVAGSVNWQNYAGRFIATSGDQNIGIYSLTSAGTTNHAGYFQTSSAVTNFGVRVIASSSGITTTNYGVNSMATPTIPTLFNVAIYGRAPANPPPPPLPVPNAGTWAGYFNGDVGYTGTLYPLSDATIKTDIEPLSEDTASSILSQINTYTYYFDTTQLQGSANVSQNLQFGFMAQQIETIAPNLVLNTIIPAVLDSAGNEIIPQRDVKMLNSLGILPLLVQANKSLVSKDSLLELRVAELEQIVNSCCGGGNHNSGSQTPPPGSTETGSIELENIHTLQLFAADPNPFSESTWVRWSLPADFNEATIFFYDNAGQQINKYKIEHKGNGELQVFGSKLSSGIYTYSLVVDNKLIDSKKIIKTK